MGADLRDQDEGDRVGKASVCVGLTFQGRLTPLLKILLPGYPCPARRLISAHHNAADTGGVVDRLHGDDHLCGRAVGAGDDALVLCEGFGVHFRYHQRHTGIHAPIAAFVHHHGTTLDRFGNEVACHVIGCAADHQVAWLKRFPAKQLHRMGLATESERRTG